MTPIRQAVILAGGKGTRLASRLNGLPKPLIDVLGTPLLERQVVLLRDAGFDDLVILVNHRADAIEAFCREKNDWGLKIRLVDDGAPRGTAGAVLAILDTLAPEFAVVYGDTLFDVDFARFEAFHAADPAAAATLFLHPNDHPHDSDLVEADALGRIEAFHPYPHPEGAWLPNMVNAALYLVRRDALAPWKGEAPPLDFAKDLFPRMLAKGQALRGYNSPEYIKDAGTPERIDKACAALASGAVERASLRHPQKAVFLDRDGTLNDDPGHIAAPEQMRVFPFAGPALKRLNDAGWRSVLVTNQPVIARGEATEAGLRRIHARLEADLARSKAYLDRIYVCPHHPDGGFPGEVPELKIQCGCRKPLPGLLLQAQTDLNVDMAESWMIGDSTADLAAAAAAGVASILVETGQAGLDDKVPAEPDFVQPDLAAAVAFLLDGYPALVARLAPLAERIAREGGSWFVGGLSRSGKSTVASVLRRELRRAGRECVVVRLDRWLLDRDQRRPGVLGRYEIAAIEECLARVGRGGQGGQAEIVPPYYSKKRRRRLPGLPLRVPPGAVVLWEGVVAGELARRAGADARFIHVEGDEAARKRRIVREYAVRDGSADEGERLYNEREADEHAPVRAWGERAAARFSPDGPLESRTENAP